MIRIVGLSATLPNYLDVARFLRVNLYEGLFFFDGRFRPVPLGQTFIGIKTTGHVKQLHDMDTVCYDKVLENVERGHQVRKLSSRQELLQRFFYSMAFHPRQNSMFQFTFYFSHFILPLLFDFR